MRLKDRIRERWNREGLKPGKAGWADPKPENRLGFHTYKDNDTGEIVAIEAIEQCAKEIGDQYEKHDPLAEAVVGGIVLGNADVESRIRTRLNRHNNGGDAKRLKEFEKKAPELMTLAHKAWRTGEFAKGSGDKVAKGIHLWELIEAPGGEDRRQIETLRSKQRGGALWRPLEEFLAGEYKRSDCKSWQATLKDDQAQEVVRKSQMGKVGRIG